MIAEDVEFQISQYVDGTLSAAERSSVDELLKADPQARALLADYQRINGQLVQLRGQPPISTVRWDRLAEHISNAIDESTAPVVAGRIGWAAWSGRLRIAAGVLIVATVGIIVHHGLHHDPVAPVNQPSASLDVDGPKAEVAAGKPSEDISVGPSARFAASEAASRYADGVIVPGPSKVVIEASIPKPRVKSRPH